MTREEVLKNTRMDQRDTAGLLLRYIDALYADTMDEVSEIKTILAEDVVGPFTEETADVEQFEAPALKPGKGK